MKCTSCGEATLNAAYLEPQLPCYSCSSCGGSLLMLSDFLRWKDNNPNVELADCREKIEAEETSKAMICPKTGTIMTKYKIASDTDHRLDLSPGINAVWMDGGEWELLKAKGLAGGLEAIFTDHWQRDVRNDESAEIMTEIYKRKFGARYDEIKSFRDMLTESDFRSEAIAYLMAENPYKP